MQMTFKALALSLVLLVSGCGLQGLNPEEQGDIYAKTSADAIYQVQRTAKRVYDAGSISTGAYREILLATIDLTVLVKRIESASDLTGADAGDVACVQVALGGATSDACSREDISEILIEIRGKL